MCGISGIIQYDGAPVPPDLLERMTTVLAHRGPDHQGTRILGSAGLGCRRLAIVDRSPAGQQPMCDERETIWIVCNGEIYNHDVLRKMLESKGFRFKSKSDTEVILYLYRLYGDDCVNYLRGMFAFAIWDTENQRLLLTRDRFGQKPLYYANQPGRLSFASEIKSLRQDDELALDINTAAIHRFLTMDYIPAPGSIFCAVNKLPAAHQLVLEKGKVTLRRYWRLDYAVPPNRLPVAELEHEIVHRLEESVQLHLMGEVPWGVYFSGGIDSNAIAALVCRHSSQKVQTFSVGFDQASHDESTFARTAGEYLGTEHHELHLSPDPTVLIPAIVRHFDEPFGDSSAIPTWCLSEMAGRHITVALAGEGGDEAFAGYDRYRKHRIARAIWLLPRRVRQASGTILGRLLPSSLPSDSPLLGLVDVLRARQESPDHLYGRWLFHNDAKTAGVLYSAEFAAAAGLDDPVEWLTDLFAQSAATDPVNAMLDVDQRSYLADDLLAKVDIAAMAHSVEVRSPFLDHEFAAFAASIPGRHKLRGKTGKWILRRALRGLVEPTVLGREKRGFGLPVAAWLSGPLREMLCDTLLSQVARERGLFDPAQVKYLVEGHSMHAPQASYLLWNLLVLELWFRSAGDTRLRFSKDHQ
jgi:asparagine synthase (glutamine-hydrolysing)